MQQNRQYSRQQTRTQVRAKRMDSNVYNSSIQSTAVSSQLNNSALELSIFNNKQRVDSTDSIMFDNNINFSNNLLESQRFDLNQSQDIEKNQVSDFQYSQSDYNDYKKQNPTQGLRGYPVQNLEFLLKPKRKLSPKQKEVNSIIGRICEERLFPVLIQECSQAGLITKEQVNEFDIKQHFKNKKAEEVMLGNQDLLNKLNLNSGYNSISNYAGTNKYLKVDLDYEKLYVDPKKTKISNRQQRIKTFFEGINPAQIKMKVLPPLKPVQIAIEQTQDTRKQKRQSQSTHIDNSQRKNSSFSSINKGDLSYDVKQNEVSFIQQNSSTQQNTPMQKNASIQKTEPIQQKDVQIKILDHRELFKSDLKSILQSNKLKNVQVYETDMDKYKNRIIPTPFKRNFMPSNYKDRVVALSIDF